MYIERIKPYEYRLPCGLIFKSQTPSVADEDGEHHFPCQRCKVWHAFTELQVPSLQTTAASARDMSRAAKFDAALLKDRIVRSLLFSWDESTYQEVATRHGVSYRTVIRVASEMGVSSYGRTRDTV